MIKVDDLHSMGTSATGVKQKVSRLLTGMHECSQQTFFSELGVIVDAETEEDIVGQVTTPAARGRLRLGWIGGPEDLSGVIHVERKQRDEQGNVVWKRVLTVLVPHKGDLSYLSANGNTVKAAVDGGSTIVTDLDWVALSVIVHSLSDFRID